MRGMGWEGDEGMDEETIMINLISPRGNLSTDAYLNYSRKVPPSRQVHSSPVDTQMA